ncbi:abortive infection protein [Plantactinospora sp. KBS50]|uniref:abortive infection protein n=1 Tax=Plantactinospora sp. KBS50 TaxID=2024580 RepID=UPI000BAA9BE2|nr:abortive infection protein [Plantactinospora sp. KBS50]ASW55088.1 hypothetical protein CIK06_14210 [Plantactinospora sp. KBS50]
MSLTRRGIDYDVGLTPRPGESTRPHFDPAQCRRDLETIANDLHCTAVRISGLDLDRVEVAAGYALDLGLEVWLCPMAHDRTAADLLAYLAEAARLAQRLHSRGTVVLVLGWELTLFMQGLVAGDGLEERLATLVRPWRLIADRIRNGSFQKRLNEFLGRAVQTARQHFTGPITYASGIWERVDWSPFDVVSVDCYRDRHTRARLPRILAGYRRYGKPVVATEFGCCCYRGAADRGGLAWTIVDRGTDPPRLTEAVQRSEQEQADELAGMLDLFAANDLDGAFVFTFATWTNPHSEDPEHDLDVAAYGIVACAPDGSWRPKRAFGVIADRYAAVGSGQVGDST